MINLQRKSFWARLYFVADEIWSDFSESYILHRDQTDTCRFLKTILIAAPLVIVLHMAAAALVIFTVLVNPILLFGVGYGWFWLSVGVGGLAVAAFIALKRRGLLKVKAPGFAKDAAVIIGTHYLGWKERFCPVIRFEGN